MKAIIVALSLVSAHARSPPRPPARPPALLNKSDSFSFKCEKCGNVNIWGQNISFVDEARVDDMYIGPHSHVYITNQTSFHKLDVDHDARLHLKQCTIRSDLPMNISGNIDISGDVSISGTTLLFSPLSTLTNNGTLVLVNNSHLVVSEGTTLNLMNNITSDETSSVLGNGTLQTVTDVFVNSSVSVSQIVVASSTLTVTNIYTQGTINVYQNASLVVQDALVLYTQNSIQRRRNLLQVGPGACVIQSLSGSGILNCQVVVYNSIQTDGTISVASLKVYPSTVISISAYDQIISNGVIELHGTVIIDLSGVLGPTNFTIVSGPIVGQFDQHVFTGTSSQPTLVYGADSVSVQVPSSPSKTSYVTIILPSVIGAFCALTLIMYIAYRKNHHKKVLITRDVRTQGYINPLMEV